ncbi:MAG: hypothetical protein QXD43_04560 [Candidatus Aenigmatarchaeota archaeon]
MDVFAQEVIKKFLSTPKSRQDLLKLTGLADRTLRYNISILKKKKLIIEYKNLKDMRKKMYLLVNV